MSNLGPQQQNISYDGLLQVEGGITSELKPVQDGDGRFTGLWLSSTGANVTTSDTFVASENGTQITGAQPRLISDGFGDYVSVKDFGAVGDGVTDDGPALLAASNYANANGVTLNFPYGVYLSSVALSWDKIIVNGNNSTIKFTGLNSSTDCLTLNGSTGERSLSINNLTIDANGCGRDGVRLTGQGSADFLSINKMFINNAIRDGFHVEPNGNYSWIENMTLTSVRVFAAGRHGMAFICPDYTAVFINVVTIINPEVRTSARLEAGYDVFVQNASNDVGKTSSFTWIGGEFDATNTLHAQHSFYFDDARTPQKSNINLDGWVFIGCTFESTNDHITGFPTAFAVSSGTKLDALQVFGSGVYAYGDIVARSDTFGITTIRTTDRYYDYYNASGWKSWYDNVSNLYLRSAGVLKTDGAFYANQSLTPQLLVNREYSVGEFIGIGGSTSGTTPVGIIQDPQISTSATTAFTAFNTYPSVAAGSFTLPSLTHYNANINTIGVGATVTNQYGFKSGNLSGATANYGFWSGLSSGSGKYNFYAASDAPNYFSGPLTIKPLATTTPANNGDLTFEATSNTSLTFKYKGSDGVVRSGSITLS